MKYGITTPSFLSASRDIPAGIVVFLVALPLCLGIALASGAPLMSGVIAGIIGGTVVAFLSGSELSVSGPAAGLAIIVLQAIASLGSFEVFLCAVVISGLLQIALGALRAGIIGDFVPNSVIRGMLAAIGVVIILKQIPHALGWDAELWADEEVIRTSHHGPLDNIWHIFEHLNEGAVIISVICLALLIVWERPFIKKYRWAKLTPGPLLAVVVGTILNELFVATGASFALVPGDGHLVQLPIGAALFSTIVLPDFSHIFRSDVFITAVTIALVGSVETLLSIEATDRLDPEKRISSTNKELVAQGIGNTLSGLVGGLPITSVIVRSSTNVYAGGRTRLASLTHGVMLLVCVLLIPSMLNHIPLAALAAILISVGYKLTSTSVIKDMWSQGIQQFFLFAVTLLAIVYTDLLFGIAVGLAVGAVFILRTNVHKSVSVVNDGNMYLISFNKDMSFVNKAELKRNLRSIPDNANLIIDGTKVYFIDYDIYEQIEEFADGAPFRKITIEYRHVFGKGRK
ncbi:MAG: SulP family inorganic anion transporter [Candidatus Kapabacteria bacterium]|nr:SulP family inorganic anion transporter [Candidatus Kapabacteria bacterium]